MTVVLRRATPADAPACAHILGDFFETTEWLPRLHSAREDTAFLAGLIASADVTVAAGDAVLGYLARDGNDLIHLYLAPQARRQGIGGRLIDHAKSRQDRLSLWCFQQNHAARAFYARHGFDEVTRSNGANNEERLADVKLEWRAA